ncbi:MAG TPA: potassium-transporting ATPase subunit KdpC [Kofleriaceae bacterium]|jgi:K+-transporting ATPase ATPase C chain
METFVVAFRATLVTLVLTGIAYPLVVTGAAQVVFPHRADGSIAVDDKGREVGSELLAQGFADPAYMHPRPSANSYDAANSGGTNLGTTSKKLRDGVVDLVATYRRDNDVPAGTPIPADAVSRSASGLDPDISPENARLQAPRIAKARGVTVDRVEAIVDEHVKGRELGFLGEPRVNVLALDLALDRSFGAPRIAAATAR